MTQILQEELKKLQKEQDKIEQEIQNIYFIMKCKWNKTYPTSDGFEKFIEKNPQYKTYANLTPQELLRKKKEQKEALNNLMEKIKDNHTASYQHDYLKKQQALQQQYQAMKAYLHREKTPTEQKQINILREKLMHSTIDRKQLLQEDLNTLVDVLATLSKNDILSYDKELFYFVKHDTHLHYLFLENRILEKNTTPISTKDPDTMSHRERVEEVDVLFNLHKIYSNELPDLNYVVYAMEQVPGIIGRCEVDMDVKKYVIMSNEQLPSLYNVYKEDAKSLKKRIDMLMEQNEFESKKVDETQIKRTYELKKATPEGQRKIDTMAKQLMNIQQEDEFSKEISQLAKYGTTSIKKEFLLFMYDALTLLSRNQRVFAVQTLAQYNELNELLGGSDEIYSLLTN